MRRKVAGFWWDDRDELFDQDVFDQDGDSDLPERHEAAVGSGRRPRAGAAAVRLARVVEPVSRVSQARADALFAAMHEAAERGEGE